MMFKQIYFYSDWRFCYLGLKKYLTQRHSEIKEYTYVQKQSSIAECQKWYPTHTCRSSWNGNNWFYYRKKSSKKIDVPFCWNNLISMSVSIRIA